MKRQLFLDPNIQFWVLIPVTAITLLISVIRHYVTFLFTNPQESTLKDVHDRQVLEKCMNFKKNCNYISKRAFAMRLEYLALREDSFLVMKQKNSESPTPQDPMAMLNVMKGNFFNIFSMIVIGTWVNWAFSGFIATKVPFPLTHKFKPMLQRDIRLESLDPSWVSSISWYFINFFGLQGTQKLLIGSAMEHPMMMAAGAGASNPMAAAQDMEKVYKKECDSLLGLSHEYRLENALKTQNM